MSWWERGVKRAKYCVLPGEGGGLGCLAPARRCRGHELKQQPLPRTPYTLWVLLALGSVLWDPRLIRISEWDSGLICSKQGGKKREEKRLARKHLRGKRRGALQQASRCTHPKSWGIRTNVLLPPPFPSICRAPCGPSLRKLLGEALPGIQKHPVLLGFLAVPNQTAQGPGAQTPHPIPSLRTQLQYLWGQGHLARQLCHRSVPANTEHRGQNGNCTLLTVSILAPGVSPALETAMGWSGAAKPTTGPGWVLLGEGHPHLCWHCPAGTRSAHGADSPGFFSDAFHPKPRLICTAETTEALRWLRPIETHSPTPGTPGGNHVGVEADATYLGSSACS